MEILKEMINDLFCSSVCLGGEQGGELWSRRESMWAVSGEEGG